MKTTVDFIVWRVEDHLGNIDQGVVDDTSDTVQVCGMRDSKDTKHLYFESDFYHLITWCSDNELQYRMENRSVII